MTQALAPLVVRYGRLGDMVLQAPLLRLLHRRWGRPCTLWTFGPWSQALFAHNPDVGAIWRLRRRHLPFGLSPQRWALVRALRRHAGPVYISEDVGGHARRIRALLARAGIDDDRCVYLSDAAPGSDNAGDTTAAVHWVDRLLAFGTRTPSAWQAAQYPWSESDLETAPRLPLTEADRLDCEEWRAGRGLIEGQLVLLQPGNKRTNRRVDSRQARDPKRWPVARWAALIAAIQATSPAFRVVLCGGAPEQPLLEEIRRAAGARDISIAARDLPIRRLLALAADAHSMVGVDTGPMHVAAAAGCPMVVLYGAESPARWDRRSPSGAPVINLGGPPLDAVEAIGVDAVVSAWRALAREALPA